MHTAREHVRVSCPCNLQTDDFAARALRIIVDLYEEGRKVANERRTEEKQEYARVIQEVKDQAEAKEAQMAKSKKEVDVALEKANTSIGEQQESIASLEENLATVYERARDEARDEAKELEAQLAVRTAELQASQKQLKNKDHELTNLSKGHDAKNEQLQESINRTKQEKEKVQERLAASVVKLREAQCACEKGEPPRVHSPAQPQGANTLIIKLAVLCCRRLLFCGGTVCDYLAKDRRDIAHAGVPVTDCDAQLHRN